MIFDGLTNFMLKWIRCDPERNYFTAKMFMVLGWF